MARDFAFKGANMLERDVETAYIEWLNSKPHDTVLGRQVRLPFGTLDVLSVCKYEGGCAPTVSEIKLGKVDDKALTQVMGYASQIDVLIGCSIDVLDGNSEDYTPVNCGAVLVGTDMTPMVHRVYHALGVSFVQHFVNHGGIEFVEEHNGGMYCEDHQLSEPLLTLSQIITAWRIDHRRRNAASLHSWDNYNDLLNGVTRSGSDDLKNTVAYWIRAK